MKVLSVTGITKSGKTTTVENVISELKTRGYSVGSVKEIHFEEFRIDQEGTNTDKHRNAGATLVTARGYNETDVMFPSMLPINKILSFYDQDFVILEGVNDINAPKILTGHCTDEIDTLLDYRAIAVSGVLSNELSEYRGLPVIDSRHDIKRLVDLIEEKVPELMPDFDPECCSACGADCHTMLKMIIDGEKNRSDCVIDNGDIKVSFNGKEIKMVPFVKTILKNTVLAIAKELNGYEKGKKIKIEIG